MHNSSGFILSKTQKKCKRIFLFTKLFTKLKIPEIRTGSALLRQGLKITAFSETGNKLSKIITTNY